MQIDPSPRYVQAKEAILELIRDGIKHGTLEDNKLPAEDKLCQLLGVSRPTVREALMALSRDSIISKKHGTGNLVHRSTLESKMRFDQFADFEALLADSGYKVEMRRSSFRKPFEEECRMLNENSGNCDGYLFQEALYLADSKPAILALNYPRCTMGQFRALSKEAANASFADFLEALSSEELVHSIVQFKPAVAQGLVAEAFNIPKGSPLLKLNEKHYSVFDHLVAQSVVFLNPTLLDFTILRKW